MDDLRQSAEVPDQGQDGPSGEGKKKRQRTVKITDYLADTETPDQDIVQRIMSLTMPVTVAECCTKMPGVSKLFFKSLPADLANPMREKLDERSAIKKMLVEQRKAEKAAAAAKENLAGQVSAINLTAREVDDIMGSDIIYRSDSPSVIAELGSTRAKVHCLLDSGADINVIRYAEAMAASILISSLPPTLAKGRMFVANGEAVRFLGMCTGASVKMGDMTIQTPLLVVDKLSWPCILGETFACRASLSMERTPSGRVTCTVTSEDGERTVTFGATLGIDRILRHTGGPDYLGKD